MNTKTTSAVARMYVIAGSVLAFFILWSLVAARPFPQAPATRVRAEVVARDPRLERLEARERAFNTRSRRTRVRLDRQWATYRLQRAERMREIAEVRRANAIAAASHSYVQRSAAPSYQPAPSNGGYVPQVRIVPVSSAPPVTSTHSS